MADFINNIYRKEIITSDKSIDNSVQYKYLEKNNVNNYIVNEILNLIKYGYKEKDIAILNYISDIKICKEIF